MRIKVQDGTPIESDHSLCTTCRCSTIVRGRTLDEELVFRIVETTGWAAASGERGPR